MCTLAHSAPETMIPKPRRGWIASLTLLFAVACDPGGSGVDPLPESCDEVETAVLGVGEVAAFDGSAASLVCVGALDGTEQFVLVGVYRTDKPASEQMERLALTASAENTVIVTSPPAASAGGGAPRGGDVVRGSDATGSLDASPDATLAGSIPLRAPRLDHEFHLGLRQRERELIGAGPRMDLPPRPPMAAGAAGRVPSVGELVELNAQPNEPCEEPIPVTGQVRAVSERAIVVADVDNPTGGFSSSNYRAFAEEFDELVVPVTEAYFGAPSDIDDNGRTILFFTKEVNAIAAEDDAVFTAGFFFARDLLRKGTAQGECETSNEAEILYLVVPDPDGRFGPARSRNFVQRITVSTIAHEQQHLVNAATRLFVTSPPLEEIWLNEGLSHIAEEAVFYEDAELEPRENIGTFTVVSSERVVEAFELFQLYNFSRFARGYLQNHELHSPFDVDDEFNIGTRGAAWHFLRYAADRDGGSDPAFFRSLVQTSATGVDNLGPAVGGTQTLFDWLGDWAVAVYADDRVDGLASRHRDLSWNHHDLWRNAFQDAPDGPYVGSVRSLQPGSPQFPELSYGGVAYYRFGVAAGQVGSVSLREGNGAPPSEFRALLLRTE